ncbi:metal-sulfur cluster assembly factor [Calditerricola satsumensis]|uniref:MIP18 family-like domain-containing protein n=1 Tax=Calditerricola satsumensis TaxID=373054 RepID=A0A8J3F9V3_9BACI|nr:iron-sulfur cluster assembly protein [Calditerricola satsumensis]GGJ98383.1 hypothetical protein GCM10007043_10390 [Calditerricola satsumensis]
MATLTKTDVEDLLRQVVDPELGVNIVDLGLVYHIEITTEGDVTVTMTLTTPGCPLHEAMITGVEESLRRHPAVRDVRVQLVWSPPWTPERMSEAAKRQLGMR